MTHVLKLLDSRREREVSNGGFGNLQKRVANFGDPRSPVSLPNASKLLRWRHDFVQAFVSCLSQKEREKEGGEREN